VVVVVAAIVVIYLQFQKYNSMNRENVDALVQNVVQITTNAASASNYATPIFQDFAFSTNVMSGALGNMLNHTNTTIPLVVNSSRHLMAYDQQDVDDLTVNMQRAVFQITRHLMETVQTKVEEFNPGAVSDFLEFLVTGVNYTGIASRYDRTIGDVELASSFLAGSMEAISVVALAKGVNISAVSDALFQTSKQSASPQAVQGACG